MNFKNCFNEDWCECYHPLLKGSKIQISVGCPFKHLFNDIFGGDKNEKNDIADKANEFTKQIINLEIEINKLERYIPSKYFIKIPFSMINNSINITKEDVKALMQCRRNKIDKLKEELKKL